MEVFVARQPIFSLSKDVVAYELLYRQSQENRFLGIDGDKATADVLVNSFLNIGIEKLSEGKPCFINFTDKLLIQRFPIYFNPNHIVIEILETVKPTEEIIATCKELKQLGYRIALDDYDFLENNIDSYKLLPYADIIKVDFLNTTVAQRKRMFESIRAYPIKWLAEKIEDKETFQQAVKEGFTYFQGYLLSKPKVIKAHDVPAYFRTYYELIHHLSKKEPQIDHISQIIEQDLSLSYKLLKLINSPAYRRRPAIKSIRHAIVLLGLNELQKWVYVLMIREQQSMKKEIPEEIFKICLTRAKMCESIADKIGQKHNESSFFLAGMFSLMDVILQIPMEQVLLDLPILEELKHALRGGDNLLKQVLDLSLSIEQALWTQLSNHASKLSIEESDVFHAYVESIEWANDLFELKIVS
ncbi:EAL and HDOD domain-containing protein [Priestia koreensis]|uniref:EAL and HDOD domain-containing protein n=1 Tax=Priestia koreensis TaxID=284581 RepID=UPI00203F4487|nr:HDOD domain-containing protein [Priestia koreensis]MCM3005293.1 HDOD domain-containing protein [Priestia koreensis]